MVSQFCTPFEILHTLIFQEIFDFKATFKNGAHLKYKLDFYFDPVSFNSQLPPQNKINGEPFLLVSHVTQQQKKELEKKERQKIEMIIN